MTYFSPGYPKFAIGDFVEGANNPEMKYGVGIVFDLDLWKYGGHVPPDWVYLVKFYNDITDRLDKHWFIEDLLRQSDNVLVTIPGVL